MMALIISLGGGRCAQLAGFGTREEGRPRWCADHKDAHNPEDEEEDEGEDEEEGEGEDDEEGAVLCNPLVRPLTSARAVFSEPPHFFLKVNEVEFTWPSASRRAAFARRGLESHRNADRPAPVLHSPCSKYGRSPSMMALIISLGRAESSSVARRTCWS